jgi:hypothetical protein
MGGELEFGEVERSGWVACLVHRARRYEQDQDLGGDVERKIGTLTQNLCCSGAVDQQKLERRLTGIVRSKERYAH